MCAIAGPGDTKERFDQDNAIVGRFSSLGTGDSVGPRIFEGVGQSLEFLMNGSHQHSASPPTAQTASQEALGLGPRMRFSADTCTPTASHQRSFEHDHLECVS
jgi:hypothetical protein